MRKFTASTETAKLVMAELKPIALINRDMIRALREAGAGGPGGITDNDARFLIDLYYTMQRQRVGMNNRIKGLDRDAKKAANAAEPHDILIWFLAQLDGLEKEVAKVLQIYTEAHPMHWFFAQTVGIGPILSAGLLAHIDIRKAPTAGHIWRFAGLDPTQPKPQKGEKLSFNRPLKTLCWKIGESFKKFSGRADAVYGIAYRKRKAMEWKRNLNGELSDQAVLALSGKNIDKETDAYAWYSGQCDPDLAAERLEAGEPPTVETCRANNGSGRPMLPPAHIDMRAMRWAEKLFIAHLQQRWWEEVYAESPPKPYTITQIDHAHFIEPPQRRPETSA